MNIFNPHALWTFKCYDNNGLVWEDKSSNIITYEGLLHALNILFANGAQIGTWYISIFSDDYRPCRTDTYAVPGYTEFTNYTPTTRPEWVEEAPDSDYVVSNSVTLAYFTFLADTSLYGASLVGGGGAPSTKEDVTGGGTLFSSVRLSASRYVMTDQVISIQYSIGAAAPAPVAGDCI